MSDDTIDEGGYVSPPIRVAVTSGYRVGETQTEEANGDGYAMTMIIENASSETIAVASGEDATEAESRAKLIVACLNRVPQ